MQYVSRHGQNKKLAEEMIEYTNTKVKDVIDEYVHKERDRLLLKRRFVDGVCFEPLSEEFGLSVTQTKNIVRKYEYCIFSHLKD